ncbi:hypothetical protein HAX54_001856, partial [Datura stramonium]|nr:hypothetical protein [Datura stramonium]
VPWSVGSINKSLERPLFQLLLSSNLSSFSISLQTMARCEIPQAVGSVHYFLAFRTWFMILE